MKKKIVLSLKALYLGSWNFYHDLLSRPKKSVDKKTMVNFKAYDVMNWETNNYNTHYLKK